MQRGANPYSVRGCLAEEDARWIHAMGFGVLGRLPARVISHHGAIATVGEEVHPMSGGPVDVGDAPDLLSYDVNARCLAQRGGEVETTLSQSACM